MAVSIRREQIEAFDQAAASMFENEMVTNSRRFSPHLCGSLDEQQIRSAIRFGVLEANRYGFSFRGPVRLYLELMLLFGSHFDIDPQYSTLHEILSDPSDQMNRAENVYDEVVRYNATVAGPDSRNIQRFLEYLSGRIKTRDIKSLENIDKTLERELSKVFPQKILYTGSENLRKLVESGVKAAQQIEFNSPRNALLIVLMMLGLGQGCIDDPFYPWISRTLNGSHLKDSDDVADRLESQLIAWFDQVNADSMQGKLT